MMRILFPKLLNTVAIVLAITLWLPATQSFGKGLAMKVAAKTHRRKLQTDDPVVFNATPAKNDALFGKKEKIEYIIDLKNNYDSLENGKVGYTLTDLHNKVISQNSVDIKLDKKASKNLTLSIPGQQPGFYKVLLTINVSDYDDTIRRVVGVDPTSIKATTSKPTDFDNFWRTTIDSLEGIPMNAKVTLQPGLSKGKLNCYLVELQSWGNITVRAWYTVAKNAKPGRKMPVWLIVPGYGGIGVKAIPGNEDLAVLAFNVRGQGNSKDRINPSREGYLVTDINNRYRYIYRGAIMDVIRAVDFIATRPELDINNIVCSGGSVGGYLSIAACSLDKRIKLCSANNPVFSDYPSLVGSGNWPMKNIEDYAIQRHLPLNYLLNNLQYYDLKNFTYNLHAKSLIGISLLDPLAPPYNEYVMLGNIKAKYKLFVYPNLGHEVPPSLFSYLSSWMMDEFGLF